MYNSKSKIATEFIDDQEVLDTLAFAQQNKSNRELIDSLLERAKDCKGLTHREAAVLLECDLEDENEKMMSLAKEIKQKL
ncbi:MAG: thiH, partial [Firmicutes bacterium]|nr:thiH [Bacillota bacterium]